MKIELTGAGKRYNREWIFRNFSYQFVSGKAYAITGPNGSGKSTLLQTIGGILDVSEGKVIYTADTVILPEHTFKNISFSAPYLELIEEMTLLEFLQFHNSFKTLLPTITIQQCIDSIGLQQSAHKQMRYYSSGMKQRVRLAQAIFSNTDVVLLDEPCSNLDAPGATLYHNLIHEYCSDRILVISSNDTLEYQFASEIINITDYKKSGLHSV